MRFIFGFIICFGLVIVVTILVIRLEGTLFLIFFFFTFLGINVFLSLRFNSEFFVKIYDKVFLYRYWIFVIKKLNVYSLVVKVLFRDWVLYKMLKKIFNDNLKKSNKFIIY